MKNPAHISQCLKKFTQVKILELFDVESRSGMEKFESGMEKFGSRIRDKHSGSATLLVPFPFTVNYSSD
jgi:hypothetical protein